MIFTNIHKFITTWHLLHLFKHNFYFKQSSRIFMSLRSDFYNRILSEIFWYKLNSTYYFDSSCHCCLKELRKILKILNKKFIPISTKQSQCKQKNKFLWQTQILKHKVNLITSNKKTTTKKENPKEQNLTVTTALFKNI